MAGFAIDIGDEGSAYAQGVAMPQATSYDVITQGLRLFAPTPKEKPTEASIGRAAYGDLATAVNGLRGLDPFQQRIKARELRTGYEMAGFVFGEDEAKLFESTLGIDMGTLSTQLNPEQARLNQGLAYLEQNPGFVHYARQELVQTGKDFTEEQVLASALARAERYQASLTIMAQTQALGREEYYNTWLPNAENVLDGLFAQATLLFNKEVKGGDATVEEIRALDAQWAQFKGGLKRPVGVEEKDWKVFQDRLDRTEAFLTELKTFDEQTLARMESEQLELVRGLTVGIVDKLKEEDPLLAMAFLMSPDATYQQYLIENNPTILKLLRDVKDGTIEAPSINPNPDLTTYIEDLNSSVAPAPSQGGTAPTGTTAPDPVASWDNRPIPFGDAALDIVDQMTGDELRGMYDFAVNVRLGSFTVDSVNTPKGRDNFFLGVAQASAAMSMYNGIIDESYYKELINDNTFEKLEILKQQDPERAELARAQLAEVVRKQTTNYMNSVAGLLSGTPFKVTGIGVLEFDPDAISYLPRQIKLFEDAAARAGYSSPTAMVADGFKRLSEDDRQRFMNDGILLNRVTRQYKSALSASKGMTVYADTMDRLGYDTQVFRSMMFKPVGDQPASQTGGILPQIEDQNPLGYNAGNIASAIEQSDLDPETKGFALRAVRQVMGTEARPTPDGAGFVPVDEGPLAADGIREAIQAGTSAENPLDMGAIDNDTVLLSIVSSLNVGQYFRNPGDGDVYYVAEKNDGEVILKDVATGNMFKIGYRNG